MTTAVIPCYASTRACVDPNNTWMMPFVTPGLVTGTPTALDPSISPLKVKVEEAVCWWWRWKKLKLKIYDLVEGFGNQELDMNRFIAPAHTVPVDHERLLAKKEACAFVADNLLINSGAPDFNTLAISATVQIFPPEGTTYGAGGANVVGDSYQIQDIPRGTGIMSPSTCDCVPVIIIDINVTVTAGTDYNSVVTNYGPADETFSGEFGGVYGGVVGEVVDAHPITLNSEGATSAFLPAATTVAKIFPIEWFGWNGTWNTDTGERL